MTEPRYFFCHLQKTGGVALLRRLGHQFPASAIYPAEADGAPPDTTVSIEHLLERWQARHTEVHVVCGHFPLCTTELLGGGFRTFTILREPVERVLSSLRHYRRAHPEERDRPLDEIYDDPMRQALLYDNHMVRMLSLTVDEMTDGMYTKVDYDEARLAAAIAELDRVDVVGLQSEYDRFCVTLEETFGWDLGPTITANVTEPTPASDELRQRIAADNPADLALYRHAAERLSAEAASS